jgi:hypothetical protein
MNKWVVFFFICCIANNFSQTSISPQFSELKGMEDQQGNTHLFYRIYSYSYSPISHWSNHIYHWDLNQDIDSLFIDDYGWESPMYDVDHWVSDLKFWNDNPAEFIYCGGKHFGPLMSGSAYIKRFDGYLNYFGFYGSSVNYLDISLINDSLLYSGFYTDPNIIFEEELAILKSSNGGRSWDTVSVTYQFLSLCPTNENIYFVENEDRKLFRTTDSGNTFNLVDSEFVVDSRFFYDSDGQHIYRKANSRLVVSNNLGEQFSWQTKYSSDSEINISVDDSTSGTIYLADKKNILVSTDFGNNFFLIKTLESDITGLYTTPYCHFLYAATRYRIYQINLWEDSLKIIKSITPISENYGWFPLNIGNYWVYSVYTSEGGQTIYWGDETRAIVDVQTSNPGSQVFVYQSKYENGDVDTTYLKLDSLSGKLYASTSGNGDYLLFDDLTAEAGDTICYEYNPAWNCQYVQLERDFNEFGTNTLIKDYYPQAPGWYFGHSLVKGIGLYEVYNGDLTTFKSILKGCIIDGVVYGDTTVVSIEDEETPVVTTFMLEQNYPNPFNPNTVISYRLPVTSNVTLKVYDVLGNEIVTLVNEEKPAGEYEVEFRPESSIKQTASGIYFYQLKAGPFIQTKKMLMIK